VIDGKYELVRLLGRGSMGEVWAARHTTLDELVAIKLLAYSAQDAMVYEAPANAVARFQFEAQLAARLSRKTRHIVRVTDHGEDHGVAYLVMELLEGETLEGRLLRRPKLPVGEVADLVAQIGRALEVAHEEGIVHRDLKPANVFLARDEEGRSLVKLLDFGIARTVHARRVNQRVATGDGLIFGTPGYMSPEQAKIADPDARCDLWALATVAYEALTGELPIDGATAEEMFANLHAFRIVGVLDRAPELPMGFAAFFGQAFAPHIAQRHTSASELMAAFARCTHEDAARRHANRPTPTIRRPTPLSFGTHTLRIPVEAARMPSGGTCLPPRAPSARSRWPSRAALRPGLVVSLGLIIGAVGAAALSGARAPHPGEGAMQSAAAFANERVASSWSAGVERAAPSDEGEREILTRGGAEPPALPAVDAEPPLNADGAPTGSTARSLASPPARESPVGARWAAPLPEAGLRRRPLDRSDVL
jgi:serine/threonine protein kinase